MTIRIASMPRSHRIAQSAVLTFGLALTTGCASVSSSASSEPIQAVSVAEVAGGSFVVIDVRERAQFDAGHVDDARWLDPAALRAEVDGVAGQVVDRSTAELAFGQAGLTPEDAVVITGEANGTSPARVAWTLQYYGHEGSIRLLDGGMTAWNAAGESVSTDPPDPGSTGYRGQPTRDLLRVDLAWMLDHLEDPDVAIFDVRTPEEYADGHIPGAINVNWTENLDSDGRFLGADGVRQQHGEPTKGTLVVYCRTGSRAAVSWALLTAAGYKDVRLYDGSWTEWGADPSTPKE